MTVTLALLLGIILASENKALDNSIIKLTTVAADKKAYLGLKGDSVSNDNYHISEKRQEVILSNRKSWMSSRAEVQDAQKTHMEKSLNFNDSSLHRLDRAIEVLQAAPPRGIEVSKSRNYEYVPNMGYYKFHDELRTWMEARDICMREGAHLAILNSQAEADALAVIYSRYSATKGMVTWIGFHDLFVEGQYVTIFDEPLEKTGYSDWMNGYPMAGRGRCGAQQFEIVRSVLYGLVNWDCSIARPFMCEL